MAERARFAHPIGSPVRPRPARPGRDDPPSLAADLHQELEIDFWAVADLAVADIGPARPAPRATRREMAVPAVVTLGAAVERPGRPTLLGLRFDVERVELPVAEPFPA